MPLLLCSEVQTGYKAKVKFAHTADHQTSKQEALEQYHKKTNEKI